MVGALVGAVVLAVGAVAVLEVTRRAAAGRLGANQVAGIRLRSTMASPAAWVAAHRAAWPVTRTASLLTVAITAAAAVLAIAGQPEASGPVTLAGAGVLLAGVLWGAVLGRRAALAEAAAGGAVRPPA